MSKKRPIIKAWSQCPYCEKWIPKRFLNYHLTKCKSKPSEETETAPVIENKKGESINDLLERVSKMR